MTPSHEYFMRSCVDNSRVIDIVAVAKKLDVDINELPVVASVQEPMAEKAVSIATMAVTMGIPTHCRNNTSNLGRSSNYC
jgi:carbon-monoxide dehydrogenase catalytic subunit